MYIHMYIYICVCELTVIVEPLASWMLLLTKLADGPTRRKKESSGNRSFSGATIQAGMW